MFPEQLSEQFCIFQNIVHSRVCGGMMYISDMNMKYDVAFFPSSHIRQNKIFHFLERRKVSERDLWIHLTEFTLFHRAGTGLVVEQGGVD